MSYAFPANKNTVCEVAEQGLSLDDAFEYSLDGLCRKGILTVQQKVLLCEAFTHHFAVFIYGSGHGKSTFLTALTNEYINRASGCVVDPLALSAVNFNTTEQSFCMSTALCRYYGYAVGAGQGTSDASEDSYDEIVSHFDCASPVCCIDDVNLTPAASAVAVEALRKGVPLFCAFTSKGDEHGQIDAGSSYPDSGNVLGLAEYLHGRSVSFRGGKTPFSDFIEIISCRGIELIGIHMTPDRTMGTLSRFLL